MREKARPGILLLYAEKKAIVRVDYTGASTVQCKIAHMSRTIQARHLFLRTIDISRNQWVI